jgi:prepilin-type N-terminal cleavage/methylation domain-containing protein
MRPMRTRLRQHPRSEQGFTLIELVVVMLILAVLTAVAVPSYLHFGDRANKNAAAADLRAAVTSVEAWHSEHGTYAGMTVAALQASFDQSIDPSVVSLGSLSATTYCVMAEAPNDAAQTAAKAGPSAPIVLGAACP